MTSAGTTTFLSREALAAALHWTLCMNKLGVVGWCLAVSLAACSSDGADGETAPSVPAGVAEPGPAGRMVTLHVTIPADLGAIANGALDDSFADGSSVFLAQVQVDEAGTQLVGGPGEKGGAGYALMDRAFSAPLVDAGGALSVEVARVAVPVLGAAEPLELDHVIISNVVLGGEPGDALRPVVSGTISGTTTRARANKVQSNQVGGGLGDFLAYGGFPGIDHDSDGMMDEWEVVADFTTEMVTIE